jgi:hypothetical protein
MAGRLSWALRRLRYGAPVIVVSGLPRSGTSMTMKMLEAGGVPVFTDGVRTADVDNPKGYFELERVKDLAREEDPSWVTAARGKAIKVISYLLKDLPPTLNYKVLLMRRDLDEILASQAKMLANRGEEADTDDGRMREIFQDHIWRASYLLRHQRHFDAIDVEYRAVLTDPGPAAARINAFLGGRLDVARMQAVVDESLYRNRREQL